MNTDDLIYVVQNQLEKDFCKHVIEKFKTDQDKYQALSAAIKTLQNEMFAEKYDIGQPIYITNIPEAFRVVMCSFTIPVSY